MSRSVVFLLATIAITGVLAWFASSAAVQPGRVQAGHVRLANDCLACHTAFSGVSEQKCLACHHVDDIGKLSVDGKALATQRPAVERLHASARSAGAECSACHAEHAGRLGAGTATHFEHAALPADVRASCHACHADRVPTDELHRRIEVAADGACAACHRTESWKPATFVHERLPADRRNACAACHRESAPKDEMHGASVDECSACHGTSAWKPSTFDHARFFRFDGDHPARCADCHEPGKPLSEYTCYGCHEHTPANLADEHREEGIRDLTNCVECHRSADEHWGEGRGDGRRDRTGDRGEEHGGGERDDD
ncbi:MAG: hypothetical protein HZA52_05780 [Planctomycetes bacterium]|nr:hypothetical protein [Planctomycetota bacterium]